MAKRRTWWGNPALRQAILTGEWGWWLSGSQLDLDFANERAFNRLTGFNGSPNSLLTYTSPSPKMVYGDDGVLRYAPHNLLTYAEQFDNAAWTKATSSITANAIAAPDGTTTADALVDDGTTGGHTVFNSATPAIATYTATVYLKKATKQYIGVQVAGGGLSGQYAIVDMDAKTASTGIGTPVISVTDVGNGWLRVALTVTFTSTASAVLTIYGMNGPTYAERSYTGTSAVVAYIWGAQLNLGSSALTYVPTTSAAVYSLPIDHDPITHAPLGVLIEEQRVNLLTYSEQFDNAAWTKGNSTVTANAATAPDGTTTADLLYPTTTGTDRRVIRTVAGLTPAANYAASVYVKAAGKSWVYMIAPQANAAADVAWFDIANGVVGTKGASVVSTSITDVGGGWYRCVLVGPADGGDSFAINVADGDNTFTATTSGTDGVYIWGAQLEAGAFATSYIPTVASQVTRAADQVSILTSAFGFSATAGTMVWKGDHGAGTLSSMWSLNDGTTGERINNFTSPDDPRMTISDDVVAVVNGLGSGVNVSAGVSFTTATAWAADYAGISIDGAAVSTDASVTLPTVNDLHFGMSETGGSQLNGHIKRLTYFPTRKTNAELQALTA